MQPQPRSCPDCQSSAGEIPRRDFLKKASAAAVALGAVPAFGPTWAKDEKPAATTGPESVVKLLYESFTPKQKETICFGWDHEDRARGLLRTYVSNNWQITEPHVASPFYTKDQQAMIRTIFEGLIQPEWHTKIDKQLQDDAGGYGKQQSIAMFGQPGAGKFEFVMTGRHMTLRCDGNSAEHVAFGGPIFYGHAAQGFNEKPDHPGNVFWPQALEANSVYKMLDEKQRKAAMVAKLPGESDVSFHGGTTKAYPGIPLAELSADQRGHVQKVLQKLIEPYRQLDRDEALACLKAQGGLDKCSLAFYSDGDLGNDQVWDCWRLEGPALVWYFRGAPHVHVWVNVADDPSVKTNAEG